ncbi:hypothetical protein [Bacillus sp. 71mf]|uniref:hypothetical protein n=1 Tax=Bacillus sp. 71mf TaxID=1761757 RepID=UPI00158716E9|nr:hypothetical protein [Bacillus sp. 71mf]
MPGLKQKKKAIAGHIVFCIAATYMLKNQNGFIYYCILNRCNGISIPHKRAVRLRLVK